MSEGSSSVGIDIAAGPEAGTGDFLGGSAELEEVADAEVEENADSRFIDFSLATPWEHLVADLERAIKAWTRQRGSYPICLHFSLALIRCDLDGL